MNKYYLVVLFFISPIVHSQVQNIEQYLDDRGRTKTRNIIKTDISEIMQANIPIIWEHRFTNDFSLQGGFGLLTLPFFQPIITPLLSQNSIYNKLKDGYSFYFQPNYYHNGFESFHIGLSFKYKRFENLASSVEYCLAFGKQWFLGRHLSIDIETGLGLNYEKTLDGISYIYIKDITNKNTKDFNLRIVVPISIKIGYPL